MTTEPNDSAKTPVAKTHTYQRTALSTDASRARHDIVVGGEIPDTVKRTPGTRTTQCDANGSAVEQVARESTRSQYARATERLDPAERSVPNATVNGTLKGQQRHSVPRARTVDSSPIGVRVSDETGSQWQR